jgi:hypothetical protein
VDVNQLIDPHQYVAVLQMRLECADERGLVQPVVRTLRRDEAQHGGRLPPSATPAGLELCTVMKDARVGEHLRVKPRPFERAAAERDVLTLSVGRLADFDRRQNVGPDEERILEAWRVDGSGGGHGRSDRSAGNET